MKRKIILFLVIIILSCLPLESFTQGENAPNTDENNWMKIIYKDFKEIEYFGFIYVYVEGDDAGKIGLDSEKLTKYAKLKFKNNFAYINYKDVDLPHDAPDSEKKKEGSLHIRIWTIGDNSPIAYHVRCKAGSYFDYFWEKEWLGYGSKDDVPDTIKRIMSEAIENIAIDFFTVRGEM